MSSSDNQLNRTAKFRSAVSYLYHNQTKHTVESLYSGDHRLDWANQPHPFRWYRGAPTLSLSRPTVITPLGYFQVLHLLNGTQATSSAIALSPGAVSMEAGEQLLSHLLYYSLSISAWKQIHGTNHHWALRVNASSGNLHPTELYVLPHSVPGVETGTYHYRVDKHELEQLAQGNQAELLWQLSGSQLEPPALVLCLTSILWREVWKYRQRGFRYCQHDMGHALSTVLLSAASLGWRAKTQALFCDSKVSSLLGLKAKEEVPALIVGLYPMAQEIKKQASETMSSPAGRQSSGPGAKVAHEFEPNELSQEQISYPLVERVQSATELKDTDVLDARSKGEAAVRLYQERRPASLISCAPDLGCSFDLVYAAGNDQDSCAHKTIRHRRSAVDMDGRKRMTWKDMQTILSSSTRGWSSDFLKPLVTAAAASAGVSDDVGDRGKGEFPDFSKFPEHPEFSEFPDFSNFSEFLIDLFVYAHRVDDLAQGLYFFDRLDQSLVPLLESDQKDTARITSCFQEIAADGCLAISMIAQLERAYDLYGERGYRLVHYEAGYIGQLLYLSSTALGYQATGIGCFIDDAINEYLALPAGQEVVYNFTIGGAVEDPRLTTLPAYDFPDPALS